MNFQINDIRKDTIEAETYDELAQKLWASSFSPLASVTEYREKTAQICWTHYRKSVRADTNENFIADLIDAGFITVK